MPKHEKRQKRIAKAQVDGLVGPPYLGVPSDWRKAPTDGAPTVISVFSGCGGSSLGYRIAGFRELLAIDFDAHACACFQLNFPDVLYLNKDIRIVTVEEILRLCKIRRGELDVLDGSPPCQGFSTAGKRKVIDSRNFLFVEFVRLIKGLQPKIFVMENVTGMVKGTMKGIFKEIMLILKALAYEIACRKLNAMWYGVPQNRERLFIIGVHKDIGSKPVFPAHKVRKPISVKEALGMDGYYVYRHSWGDGKAKKKISTFDKPALTLCKTANANNTYIVDERHSKRVIDAWEKSMPVQSLRKAVKYVGSYQSCRLDPDKPSMTCIKSHRHWHYAKPRQLTDLELKRICSFPDDFELVGSRSQRAGLLGNSVMPLQMKAIAETIKKKILIQDDTDR